MCHVWLTFPDCSVVQRRKFRKPCRRNSSREKYEISTIWAVVTE